MALVGGGGRRLLYGCELCLTIHIRGAVRSSRVVAAIWPRAESCGLWAIDVWMLRTVVWMLLGYWQLWPRTESCGTWAI
eukprot:737020-Pyramimonas_sp.AAC.1